MIHNFSRDIDYHSQINNRVVPYESCNTTSEIMALKQACVELPDCGSEQPEDELSRFLRTDEAYRMQTQLAPWSVGAYPPQQVHACLEWGVNSWVGRPVDVFTTGARARDLVMVLDTGGGVVLSGRFPMPKGDLGHIVSLAGYEEKRGELVAWIIDDPYGDWHAEYRDYRGNDIKLSLDEFRTVFDRGDGKYWAHLVRSV